LFTASYKKTDVWIHDVVVNQVETLTPTSTSASWPCITLQQECLERNYLAQPQHTALCTQVAMETHSWSLSMSLQQHSQASRHSAARGWEQE